MRAQSNNPTPSERVTVPMVPEWTRKQEERRTHPQSSQDNDN